MRWPYAYVAHFHEDAISVVDVSTPSSPTAFGMLQDATNLNGANEVAISADGNYAYLPCSNGQGQLTVVDVTVKSTPSIAATLPTNITTPTAGAVDLSVHPSRPIVYVTTYTTNSLLAVDVTHPTAPRLAGRLSAPDLGSYPIAIVAVDDLVYVAERQTHT